MFKNVRVNWWVAGVLGAAAYALSTGAAKAEPPAYYSRTYTTHTYVDYGPAYVPAPSVTYVQPSVTYVEPAVTYVQPSYTRVVYSRPAYVGGYFGSYGGPRYCRPYYGYPRPYAYRPYYGGYGHGHRSWGFGFGGGHRGGGFGFHYSR